MLIRTCNWSCSYSHEISFHYDRSGKSSIQKVVFHKMTPNETLFLESTNKIESENISNSSFVQFKILDFPGQIDFFEPSFDSEKIFGGQGALVFVIDAQVKTNSPPICQVTSTFFMDIVIQWICRCWILYTGYSLTSTLAISLYLLVLYH